MKQKSVLGKGLASLLPGVVQTSPPEQAPANSSVNVEPPSAASSAAAPVETKAPVASASEVVEIPAGAGAVAAGPAVSVEVAVSNKDRHPGITVADPESIEVNPFQPRREFREEELKELADSIRENGIIQPLVVRKGENGFQLIAGERRLRAAKLLGLKQVPVVVRKSTDRESLELALIENIQRQDLNCIDTALAYFQLAQEFTLTQEEISKKVGKDRATVANHLRLLRLPEAIIDALKSEKISFGHGKALLGTDDHETRTKIFQKILANNLSVREVELLVQDSKNGASHSSGSGTASSSSSDSETPVKNRMQTASQDLTRKLGTRVEIKGSERRGKIVVHYHTREELDRLLNTL